MYSLSVHIRVKKYEKDSKSFVNYWKFIGGDKDCVIISNIDVDNTIDNVGTMYLKKEDGSYAYIILSEIESCDDIRKSVRISDSIIGLLIGGKVYLLNYKKGSYEIINVYGMFE